MNKLEAYSAWAPEDSVWSKWVKPTLFAFITESTPQLGDAEPEQLGISVSSASTDTGLVIDLDGPRGVIYGLRTARKGYRPIPLYNACPQPRLPTASQNRIQGGLRFLLDGGIPKYYAPVVDVSGIVCALAALTDELRSLSLPWYAPPAFLLDYRRRGMGKQVAVGMFDNRSVVFASDFPSADFLKDRGVRKMIMISETSEPQFDIAAVLSDWEEKGIIVEFQHAGLKWDPKQLVLPRPSRLRKVWFWFQSHLNLQWNFAGGYGRVRGTG